MDFTIFFKELLAIALGVLIALVFTFYIIWPKIENLLLRLKTLQQSREQNRDNLQLQFAAYERLILFTHRISPKEVMLRNHASTHTVLSFKQAVISDIENEFQHNFTQQLYVSDAAWKLVKDLKDNTITLLRNASQGLNEEATLDQYVAVVLKHVQDQDVNPYEATQLLLKRELTV